MTIVQTYAYALGAAERATGDVTHAAVMWRLDGTGHWLKLVQFVQWYQLKPDDCWTQHAGFVVPDCRLTQLRLSRQLS